MPTGLVEFPFLAGQDEGKNAKVLPMPRLKRAVNLRCIKPGELRKIRGMAAVGTATVDLIGASPGITPTGPVRLFTHGDQLLACGETSIFTLSEATSPSKWEEVEDGIETTVGQRFALGHYGNKDIAATACARTSLFTVYAWFTTQYTAEAVSGYELHVMTVDNATGAGSAGTKVTIAGTSSETINPSIKAIALGSKVTLFWAETVSAINRIRYLDITSATSGPYLAVDAGTNLFSGGIWDTAQFFDVANHGSGYVIAYDSGAGLIAARYNSSHALQATAAAKTITGVEARVGVVGNLVDGSSTIHLYVVTDNGDNTSRVVVYGVSDAIATISTYTDTSEPLCLAIACGEFDTTRSQMVYGTETQGVRLKYIAGGALATQGGQIANTYVCGKPIGRDGKSYFGVQYLTSRPSSMTALVRIDPGFDGAVRSNLVARPEVRLYAGRAVATLSTGSVTGADPAGSVAFISDVLHMTVPCVDRFSGPITQADPTGDSGAGTTNVVERVGVDAWSFEFGSRDRYQTAQLGGYTFLGGGTVLQFDGKRAVECGFWSYPDVDAADLTVASTGGAMADGTYTYAFVWEWHDYLGNRHQSAAKFVEKEVAEGTGTSTVTIVGPPGLSLTFKHWRIQGTDSRPVVLAIYRSRSSVEDDNGGTLSMHRLEGPTVAPFLSNGPAEYTSIGTYVDEYNSDTIALVSREFLYTSTAGANELDNVPPPPATSIVAHDDRLIGIDATNPRQLWYSKQMFEGAGAAWNETLTIPLEEPATALASQDGNLLVFTARGIYTVIGRPADNTGATTGYEPPQRLSTELGCSNQRSVIATPGGTFFESDRGIYVMPRGGMDAQFIGKPVEDTLATYPVITSAVHVPNESTVLFSCMTSEVVGATGRVVAYQYDIGQWFVREYNSEPVSTIAVHGGNVAIGIYDNADACTVWREDSGWDLPGSLFVGWTIETGDIRLGGFAGSQTVNYVTVLGERLGTCQLRIRENVDGTGYSNPVDFVLTATEAELLRRYQTKRRKSTSLRLELSERQYGNVVDTQGLAVTGMTLEAAALGGSARLAAWRQG